MPVCARSPRSPPPVYGMEAKKICDQAAALAAYARQRDDKKMRVWVSEIHKRACIRIGQLSRELEKAPGRTSPRRGGRFKGDALAEAGITPVLRRPRRRRMLARAGARELAIDRVAFRVHLVRRIVGTDQGICLSIHIRIRWVPDD